MQLSFYPLLSAIMCEYDVLYLNVCSDCVCQSMFFRKHCISLVGACKYALVAATFSVTAHLAL